MAELKRFVGFSSVVSQPESRHIGRRDLHTHGPRDYIVHPRPSRWRSLAARGAGTRSLHLPRNAAKGTCLITLFAIGGQIARSTRV
jgi:hypothetical protein